ncbi:hypothetical protein B0T19DRAFT_1778 [Cercophora scortea]|uniref:Uncharacterized protein n=1 Tax=Cercophora scortea TaxID=314031 RepID=A0AAE0MJR8_9PEZI|nr:hypothetical protein B0T19DRAFT_1778 [Cercophora scortea]
MASISTQTQQAEAKEKDLLDILAETDHAPSLLAQQKQLIADLQTELAASDKRVAEAAAHLASHEKSRSTSLLRRLVSRGRGGQKPGSEKALREEMDYLSALQTSSSEKQTNQTLTQQLFAAQTPVSHLESLAARHVQAQQALEALYDTTSSITDPRANDPAQSPSEKEEDAAKKLNAAAAAYNESQTAAAAEAKAVSLLRDALRSLVSTLNAMRDAAGTTSADLSTDLPGPRREDEPLIRAETQLGAARLAVARARTLSTLVPDMLAVDIEREQLMRDMYMDSTGLENKEAGKRRVGEAVGRVKSAADAVDRMVTEAVARCREMDELAQIRGRELREAREELQRARRATYKEKCTGC